MIGLLYWILTLVSCGYAAAAGGRDGRWAVFLLLAVSLLTIPATRLGHRWASTELALFGVDLAFLIGLYVLMLQSRRLFPIWMTGFHLIVITTHLSTMLAPDITPKLYRAMASFWAVPITLSMVLGIALDRRAGVTR